MERIIKFRVWDNRRKEMLYSDTGDLIYWDFKGGWSTTRSKDRFVLNNGNAELMQYTGSKDKDNKNEVYHNDIVYDYLTNRWYIIEWDKGNAEFYLKGINTSNDYFHLICLMEKKGNVFENPELIKNLK